MEPVYIFFIRNDVWIYIVCALGLFWYTNEYFRSRRILRRAVFGLEKEKGQRARNNALIFMFLFAVVISVVYYVNDQIAPDLPAELFKPPTPTPNIFVTPLSSPTPLGTAEIVRPSPTPPLVPTITLPGQILEATPLPGSIDTTPGVEPTITSTPEATVTPFIGCTLDLNISEPRNGAFVSGVISFSGTADFEDFSFYRLEANGPETNGQWASLLGRTISQPVREGFLGNVNLSEWGPGPYLIRLTGVNTADSDVGFCVIQVTLN